ncbi:chromatin assembly factor 1 subunit B [Venturia canescens]|uniref:chromatin assembly factor 1 subunit B n=1 Tax=Venturia canescens TaxID=32260 RepID=UPI001C9D22A3|nr:chromatin assembly factor 1 subunit B [Venturia canescens]
MKCTIPEISWHNRDPVLSVDIQTKTSENSVGNIIWRLATGGSDSHVLIWHITIDENDEASTSCVADLERHQKAVNVVRFSPSGEVLASGDDESSIILWKQKNDFRLPPLPGEKNLNKEQWNSWKVLRGHLEDVYDLNWSPDSNFLISGSVDNTAIVWDVAKGRSLKILQDYKGFVQGVAWDPQNRYICTLSTDRHCRLVDVKTLKTVQKVHKAKLPTPPDHPLKGKFVRLFHDDTLKSFVRRLTFTIDGSLIIAPSGIIETQESSEKMANATIVFTRKNLKEPVMVLPSLDASTVAVRCCPIYFELRADGPTPMFSLPYRMVFAVATLYSVMLYDTQQIAPIAIISNIHYTRLTDLAWSSDGKLLVISSTDGYCSIVHFEDGELGKVFKNSKDKPKDESSSAEVKEGTDESIIEKSEKKAEKLPDVLVELDNDAMDFDIKKCKPTLFNEGEKEIVEEYVNEDQKIDQDSQDIQLIYTETNDTEMGTKNTKVHEKDIESSEIKAKNVETNVENMETDAKNIEIPENVASSPKAEPRAVLTVKTPRRVKLITISSPKRRKND